MEDKRNSEANGKDFIIGVCIKKMSTCLMKRKISQALSPHSACFFEACTFRYNQYQRTPLTNIMIMIMLCCCWWSFTIEIQHPYIIVSPWHRTQVRRVTKLLRRSLLVSLRPAHSDHEHEHMMMLDLLTWKYKSPILLPYLAGKWMSGDVHTWQLARAFLYQLQ